ncbi:hypothetical protein NQ318_000204, partial [Aromia moschata]
GCGWCGKSVEENTGLTSASATFCSELCFSQSRRATFKKNKTCDWCRHVRHTVSYVDFQFKSKSFFTLLHVDPNYLQELTRKRISSVSHLKKKLNIDGASQLQFCSDKCLNQYKMHIFCRETRAHLELHPHLPVDESTSGTLITPDLWLKNCRSPERRTPSPSTSSPKSSEKPPQTSPLPPHHRHAPLKADSPESKRNRLKMHKKTRKRLPSTITCNNFSRSASNDAPEDLRIRHTPTDFEARVSIEENIKISQKEKLPEPVFGPAPPAETRLPTPQYFPSNQEPPSFQPSFRKPFDSILPPPTIIVPYPLILPLPIPIPIPIPIPNVLKKDEAVKEVKDIKKIDASIQTETVLEENGNGSNTSQHEVVDVVSLDDKEEEEGEVKKVGRPLRKRKKICEPKGRIIVKTRKVISASST